MKVILFLACFSLAFAAVAAEPHVTRPHDCCWGPGCTVSQSIHDSETASLRCLNTNSVVAPTIGLCEEFGYKFPGWVRLSCDVAGCHFQGSMKCPLPGGGYAYPSYTMECPAQAGVLPVAGGGFNTAQCLFPNGSNRQAGCSSDGTAVLQMVW